MAIFWPTPFFKRKTFDRSGFLTDQTLISASAVPIYGEERGGGIEREREGERGGGGGAGGERERDDISQCRITNRLAEMFIPFHSDRTG